MNCSILCVKKIVCIFRYPPLFLVIFSNSYFNISWFRKDYCKLSLKSSKSRFIYSIILLLFTNDFIFRDLNLTISILCFSLMKNYFILLSFDFYWVDRYFVRRIVSINAYVAYFFNYSWWSNLTSVRWDFSSLLCMVRYALNETISNELKIMPLAAANRPTTRPGNVLGK